MDNLEGGLDGVVQAIVCDRQVGWAHQARKLMLVATDGFLHFAGEGKVKREEEKEEEISLCVCVSLLSPLSLNVA